MSCAAIARAVTVLALGTAVLGCDDSGSPPEVPEGPPADGDVTVAVVDDDFEPEGVRVTAGSTVTWEWQDTSSRHNVVADTFESETQAEGTFSHTFTEPGTFTYVCTLHSGMDGVVEVE